VPHFSRLLREVGELVSTKVDLKMIPKLFGFVNRHFSTEFSEARGQHGADAIYRGFHIARGLKRDQLLDCVEGRSSLLAKVAQLCRGFRDVHVNRE
jgi:hypothetical protein